MHGKILFVFFIHSRSVCLFVRVCHVARLSYSSFFSIFSFVLCFVMFFYRLFSSVPPVLVRHSGDPRAIHITSIPTKHSRFRNVHIIFNKCHGKWLRSLWNSSSSVHKCLHIFHISIGVYWRDLNKFYGRIDFHTFTRIEQKLMTHDTCSVLPFAITLRNLIVVTWALYQVKCRQHIYTHIFSECSRSWHEAIRCLLYPYGNICGCRRVSCNGKQSKFERACTQSQRAKYVQPVEPVENSSDIRAFW